MKKTCISPRQESQMQLYASVTCILTQSIGLMIHRDRYCDQQKGITNIKLHSGNFGPESLFLRIPYLIFPVSWVRTRTNPRYAFFSSNSRIEPLSVPDMRQTMFDSIKFPLSGILPLSGTRPLCQLTCQLHAPRPNTPPNCYSQI